MVPAVAVAAVTVPDELYCPGRRASRCRWCWPCGRSIRSCRRWLQVPPAQLVLPSCCTERPFGPTAVPEFENCPGALRVTVPVLVAAPPGPTAPPACEQLPPPHDIAWPPLNSPRGCRR
jgi:hypothetical protein